MLKHGTLIELESELGSRVFSAGHATNLLRLMAERKKENPTWWLPKGSPYIFEDGEIKLNPDTKSRRGKKR